ncbi:DNA mismatch repair endonuclease MutL [Butyrivibrio sp. AE2032]|uniref:DNA mismatch repair endonuclease MutL n=1 Tax=Butyrivibrio sp. AE2032 TaxID=1458463 RepID=UPI00055947D3|nr:DNA mismatch repair endonuclease MutL [Butyrivibrio sp. AE2032]
MGRINVLDTKTANAIKAGEVIERPVSVVKELFDNALDSGATRVTVEFAGGGISLIRVTDDGCGMDREDAEKAFLIHATSKLQSIEDIYTLSTMGFRGEALASIAACSDVTLTTSLKGEDKGTRVVYEDGSLKDISECPSCSGTTVEVRNLFKNLPARYKFLKKDSTEGMYITGLIEKLAIIAPEISIKLIKDGTVLFTTPGNGSATDAVYAVYGKETAKALVPVSYKQEGGRIEGFTGLTSFVRGNRGLQVVFVNGRLIHSKTVSAAIDEAYKNAVMKNKFPICFLMIYCEPGTVDVNVHPQKSEVKFSSDNDIFRLVYHGIKDALNKSGEAGMTFGGIASKVEEEAESGTQLRYDFSASQSASGPSSQTSSRTSSPSVSSHKLGQQGGDPAAANRLLKILSEFKPDIEALKEDTAGPRNGTLTETQPESQTQLQDSDAPGVPDVFIPPVTENTQPKAPAIIDDVTENRTITDIDRLAAASFVGIIFSTYIILQNEDICFIVDQHAAHERVLYEEFMVKKKPGAPVAVEQVLTPQILTLSWEDYSFVEDNLSRFEENGFELELLGDRQIAVRTVPLGKAGRQSAVFGEILTDLKREVPSKSDIWYQLIQTTACKAAVRAGDRLTEQEAMSLIEKLSKLEDPYHCAHGRPTFFTVSKKDYEKNFKRIV